MGQGVQFGVNHRLARKLWANELATVAPKESNFFRLGLVGKGEDSPIMVRSEMAKEAGMQVTYGLVDPLFGTSTIADDVLEGKERDLNFNDGYITIGQERIAQKTGGKLDETRVPYDVRNTMKKSQAQWWGEHYDEVMLTKLSGSLGVNTWNTIDSRTIKWDRNVLNAASTYRAVGGAGVAGFQPYSGTYSKTDLTSANTMTLEVFDLLRKIAIRQSATSTRRKMRKPNAGGKKMWIALIDELQWEQIIQSTDKRAYDLMRAEVTGSGDLQKSPLWGEAKFVYRDIVVHVAEEMVRFDTHGSGANLKAIRGLFLGAQAGFLALGPGESGSAEGYYWKERKIDYENRLGVATGKIWGFDKCRYSTSPGGATYEDYGVIPFDTYVGSF